MRGEDHWVRVFLSNFCACVCVCVRVRVYEIESEKNLEPQKNFVIEAFLKHT